MFKGIFSIGISYFRWFFQNIFTYIIFKKYVSFLAASRDLSEIDLHGVNELRILSFIAENGKHMNYISQAK